MRTTPLARRTAPDSAWWKADYLAASTLHRALSSRLSLLEGDLLDVGCGNRPYRALLSRIATYLPYDIDAQGSTPGVIGTAERLPFASESFDSVLCTQVLEHVADPWRVVEEIRRVLRPGGRVVLSAPQAWRLHEEPFDYYRYTRYGLEHMLVRAGLRPVDFQSQGGAWRLAGQVINNHLWRRPWPKYTPAWWLGTVASALVNVTATLLDRQFPDQGETMNYVVLAERPSS